MKKSMKSKLCYLLPAIPDKHYLYFKYFFHMKKILHLNPPVRFNEKLQWLKLYDRKPFYTSIVDKLQVRHYIEEKIGSEYLVPLLGSWDDARDINFEGLPNSFVLKCTHDSGSVIICKDKSNFDIPKARAELNESLKQSIYYNGREWPYKNVKPKIIAEKYLEDENSDDLTDYKFMCFNGCPKCLFTTTNRHKGALIMTFFDLNWNKMPFERHYTSDPNPVPPPKHLSQMILLAQKLAKDFTFVRVDFYEVNDKIYFGELTLFPGSGFEEFKPDKWDYIMGSWLDLPKEL